VIDHEYVRCRRRAQMATTSEGGAQGQYRRIGKQVIGAEGLWTGMVRCGLEPDLHFHSKKVLV
jgi:hypothetical protein